MHFVQKPHFLRDATNAASPPAGLGRIIAPRGRVATNPNDFDANSTETATIPIEFAT